MKTDRSSHSGCSPPVPQAGRGRRRLRRRHDLPRSSSSTPSAWSRAPSSGSPASRRALSPTSTSRRTRRAWSPSTSDPSFPDFKADASCSSEPQSLIAEYFLDCQPGTSSGRSRARSRPRARRPRFSRTSCRTPCASPSRERLQLLINEFGTALDANAENLNAAIRPGAPALQQLKQVLDILGQQNTTIAELNTNSDAIFAALAHRTPARRPLHRQRGAHRGGLGRAHAPTSRRTSTCSTASSPSCRPTMDQLGELADVSDAAAHDLHAAAPGLNKLAHEPAARSTTASEQSLTFSAAPRRSARRARQGRGRDRGAQSGEHEATPPPTRSPSSSRDRRPEERRRGGRVRPQRPPRAAGRGR